MNSSWQSAIGNLIRKSRELQNHMDEILKNEDENFNTFQSKKHPSSLAPNPPVQLIPSGGAKSVAFVDNEKKDDVTKDQRSSSHGAQNVDSLCNSLISTTFESENWSENDDLLQTEIHDRVVFPDNADTNKVLSSAQPKLNFKPLTSQKRANTKSPKSLSSRRRLMTKPSLLNVQPKLNPVFLDATSCRGNNASQPSNGISHDAEPILLHCIVMVPSGIGFTSSVKSKPRHAGCLKRNLFLVCRMFWAEETVHSRICWDSGSPEFNFCQIAPVIITTELLQRMQNNIMVIEVWEKKLSTKLDEIVGVCKLPLHIFYLSFRDMVMTKAILQLTNAVVALNDYVKAVDIFSGTVVGKLKVFLAMGTYDQIRRLQETTQELYSSYNGITLLGGIEMCVRYTFEISINFLEFVHPPGSSIWGDSDSYVKYAFPHQEKCPTTIGDWKLSTFTIGPQLCEPKIFFKSSIQHELIHLSSLPLENLLKQVFLSDEITFQIWCTYYYPVECNELVAKAYLPLSSLCALIYQRERQSLKETFLLHLFPCGQFAFYHDKDNRVESLGIVEIGVIFESTHLRMNNPFMKDTALKMNDTNQATREVACARHLPPNIVPKLQKWNKPTSEISLKILVEKGSHLSNIKSAISGEEVPPNSVCSVSHPQRGISSVGLSASEVIIASNDPFWNWLTEVSIPAIILTREHKNILFSVWHIDASYTVRPDWSVDLENTGMLIGTACVDLTPLLLGMQQLNGWYNVINLEGMCTGQIKVAIEPLHDLENFHLSPKRELVGLLINKTVPCFGGNSDLDYHVISSREGSDEPRTNINEIEGRGSSKNPGDKPTEVNSEKFDKCSRSFLFANLRENLTNMELVVNQCLEGFDKSNDNGLGNVTGTDSSPICNYPDVGCENHEEEITILPNTINCASDVVTLDSYSKPHRTQTKAGSENKKSRLAASIFSYKD